MRCQAGQHGHIVRVRANARACGQHPSIDDGSEAQGRSALSSDHSIQRIGTELAKIGKALASRGFDQSLPGLLGSGAIGDMRSHTGAALCNGANEQPASLRTCD
jgi:hypothetical protein